MYNRIISSHLRKTSKSILLLGPRQVGKSTLIKSLKPDLEINLASEEEYFLFQSHMDELERRIQATSAKHIFIDEIQRIPRLTNSIQVLIDNQPRLKFYLTGSSARKLKAGRANLLPGRLLAYHLSPLSIGEIGKDWDESLALSFGTLPGIYSTRDPKERKKILQSYSNQYLKEEILAEALVRRVDGFVRFMSVAAADSGNFVDYSKMSKKAKCPRQSAVRHFEILEDTLIIRKIDNDPHLDPDQVDLIKHPRFFFFDQGVLNALRGSFDLATDRIGNLYEHLVFNQVMNSATANDLDAKIYNFRTRGGLEVDFIVSLEGQRFAVECKSSSTVNSSELSSLNGISKYYKKIGKILIYRGTREYKHDGVWIVPLPKALDIMGLS